MAALRLTALIVACAVLATAALAFVPTTSAKGICENDQDRGCPGEFCVYGYAVRQYACSPYDPTPDRIPPPCDPRYCDPA